MIKALDIEEQDDIQVIEDTEEFDKNCDKCQGKGYYLENGLEIACDCNKKLTESRKQEHKVSELKNISIENCVTSGLVPEDYKELRFNSSSVKKKFSNLAKSNSSLKVYNLDFFLKLMDSILLSCKTGSKLSHSYLLGCDKGYAREELVYECIKYLYQQYGTSCNYLSLLELGSLRADSIKQAQAINNSGFYYKDTDRELLQRTIDEEGKRIIRSLVKSLPDVSSFMDINKTKNALLQLENQLLEKVYAKTAEEKRIGNLYDSFKEKIVNTWEDYTRFPLVFTYFSGTLDRQYEIQVLQELLNIRGTKGLPTICFVDTALGLFSDEPTYFDDTKGGTYIDINRIRSYYLDNMLINQESLTPANKHTFMENLSSVDYTRLVYVCSYFDFVDRWKVGRK